MSTITTSGLEACPRCDTPIKRGLPVCPVCGLRFETLAAPTDAGAAIAGTNEPPSEVAQEANAEGSAYTGPESGGEDTPTGPLESERVDGGESDGAGDEAADAEDASFITGESVPRSTSDTDTGALAGRSTRASEDPIFASLPDAEFDTPTGFSTSAAPNVPYDAWAVPDVPEVPDAPDALEAPGTDPEVDDARDVVGAPDVPYDAALDVDPGPAPEAVRDVASDIARDAEAEPEIVGAPVAMAIPTTPMATVAVEDQQRSRNQLLAAAVAAIAVLVLCVAVILAVNGGSGGNGTPTPQAGNSPTVPVIAVVTNATSTPEPATPVPPTATVEASTATLEPVVAPTDTPVPPAPTDTAVVVPTDTIAPAPTDTPVPAPTDTIAPVPTDTTAPAPTDTRQPQATNTTLPPPTNTRAAVPTSTRVPATRTPLPPQPTATRPAPPPTSTPSTHAIGDLVTDFNGWVVVPVSVQTASQLPSANPRVIYRARGLYWLVRVDVRNTLAQSRSFGGTMDFVMRDANGNLYAELSNHGTAPGVREIARTQGMSYLNAVLRQGDAAATLLIYDIPTGVRPVQLVGRIIEGNGVSPDGQVVWNLQR
ncbi:MAG TPA: hypothetical protein VGE04_13905 [Chloroflexia bacterium]|jgi:RNA polymerase subunit RPABC4/transcription elongation factor Spt4